jgi:hypothetical protein
MKRGKNTSNLNTKLSLRTKEDSFLSMNYLLTLDKNPEMIKSVIAEDTDGEFFSSFKYDADPSSCINKSSYIKNFNFLNPNEKSLANDDQFSEGM